MKGICVVLMILGLLALAAAVSASTLENADGQSYVVEVTAYAHVYRITMLSRATASVCTYTCQLILPQTGQSLTVQPDDDVVINNGVMTVGR